MSAHPSHITMPLRWGTLRTVLASARWANLLLGVCWLLTLSSPLLDGGTKKAISFSLALSACSVMLWATLSGSRLIGITLQAAQLRLPNITRQSLRHGLVALVLAIFVPSLLLAVTGSTTPVLNLLVLLNALLLGLFWVSMPPWIVFPLIALGYAFNTLDNRSSGITALFQQAPLLSLAASAAALLLLTMWFWRRILHHPATSQWGTSIAQLVSNDSLSRSLGTQGNLGAGLFGPNQSISHELARNPVQALGTALGPGFVRMTPMGWLLTQVPILSVSALWLMLNRDDIATTALLFTPLLVISASLPPVMRLLSLLRQPPLGLHEPALLPGLPPRPAIVFAGLLARQMLLRALPAWLIMAGSSPLLGTTDPDQQLLLLWSCTATLLWLHAAALFSLQSGLGRTLLIALIAVLTLALVISAMLLKAEPWLVPAWSGASAAGALASALARRRLEKRPHPWLQN